MSYFLVKHKHSEKCVSYLHKWITQAKHKCKGQSGLDLN